jgi:pectinesterase
MKLKSYIYYRKKISLIMLFQRISYLFFFIPAEFWANQERNPKDTSYNLFCISETNPDYPYIKIAVPELNTGITVKENLVYDSNNGRDLHLDIFSPANKIKSKYPAVILIHGGGWRSGNKSMQHTMAARLAAHNYIAAAVEYRLSPEALYPARVTDLKNSVKWIRRNAGSYNIDENKIAVLGCSAGGTLAALLGTTNGDIRFEDTADYSENLSDVQAIIDIDGVLDFTDPAESGKDNDPLKPSAGRLWFGASYKENPELWREASPIYQVNKRSAPIIFINSSIERFHAKG